MTSKARLLKAMNTIICNANDEDDVMPWLMGGVPDGADDDDYEDIAEDKESMIHMAELFLYIVSKPEFELYLGRFEDGSHVAVSAKDYD